MSNNAPSSDRYDDEEVIEGFPSECLPNEMREAVLKNIHDPQDKLNVLDALPPRLNTERLMYWDYTSTQFEMIYPLVYPYLKWPYEDDDCSWKNVLKLCRVSAEFQIIVLKHYEKNIHFTHSPEEPEFQDRRQEPIWISDPLKKVRNALSYQTSPAWLTTLPFGISTSLTTGGGVKLLKEQGGKLWSLEISLIFAYRRIPGIINYLMKCLHLVPNLRRLGLADFYPNQHSVEGPPIVLLEERLVLPELPEIKVISLTGDCFIIQQWILPKYTHQLEVLDFQDCYLMETFNPTCFPKLETIHIKFTQTSRMEYKNASIDNVNDLLNKFLLSPLKVITVRLDNVDVPKFFNFMLTLNNFGKTLGTLEMKFGRMNGEMGLEVMNGLEGWISQLDFPNMSSLHLDCYVGPLEFLLRMATSLRKLSIITSSLEPLQRSNVNGLNFSVEREVMLESSMWQRFPVLEWFKMDTRGNQNQHGQPVYPLIPGIYITRECYEKYQRNMAR